MFVVVPGVGLTLFLLKSQFLFESHNSVFEVTYPVNRIDVIVTGFRWGSGSGKTARQVLLVH